MKTKSFLTMVLVVAFFMSSNLQGQTYHQEVVVTIDGLDYGAPIGVVTGTYMYKFSYQFDKSGILKSLHWNVIANDLVNDSGDKVIVIDSGLDTFGPFWDMWNNIGAFNEGYPIWYDVEDGWLDDILPAVYPDEGTLVSMSTKLLCKGAVIQMAAMLQIHRNANGDITAEVRKGWFE